ncbi:gamma-glutamylcyclotransferase [Paraflavisolibacter sp. H34]|uniref:gamma-glutamylcyclotransferase family protein n=1 Tax=Huijunlia imazamoxiresistens TaxID=3127457 RepID=UPI0030193CAF
MAPCYLFVYGTLRKGCANDLCRKFPGALLLGEGTVQGSLFELEGLPYPGLLLDGAGPVAGEVYAVDGETVHRLDEFEGFYPGRSADSYYFRREADVQLEGGTLRCFVYETNPRKLPLGGAIEPADWKRYLERHPAVARRTETWPEDLAGLD